ncbi:MAG: osmotically inducible protein OsmC [Betaproteobacteria bacterium RIFCSPLOWO2_12_FULL_65_14]|nr:MAG: osmotically inducible protein OsmC [Betaproteobacteria bacterium RIFCSPLOWO2_12_FULL_65_14]
MSRYAELFHATRTALQQAPDQASARFSVSSRGKDGLHREVQVRDFSLTVDEPSALGGTNQGPNPVEYALAALATCQEITYRLHADAMGIPVNEVSVVLEGELDLRGFFNAAEGVRPGFLWIQGEVSFDSPASPEELARLKQAVDAHCPVLDLLRNPTPVRLSLSAR